eukprot:TRINITY_DN50283_c0_g1_i1.p1 TRINITY_DN50283_c0_g1~~TRINITY_DN50283_c0_g1_i1.p1  ORF type:complete len:254 (-),score=55.65 TRINITY_DN50283_c0_g1_i1:124-885(-)
MQQWQKIVAAAGGAVALGSVLYCLLRDDADAAAMTEGEEQLAKARRSQGVELSVEELLQIMQEMMEVQSAGKSKVRDLAIELAKSSNDSSSFPQIYARVKDISPQDPLERRGLTLESFDASMRKYQNDDRIRASVQTLMTPMMSSLTPTKPLSVDMIVKVHEVMAETLESFSKEFKALPDKSSYDMKIVLQASQVVVNKVLYEQFKVTDNDIETSLQTIENPAVLQSNRKFMDALMKVQTVMDQLSQSAGMQA